MSSLSSLAGRLSYIVQAIGRNVDGTIKKCAREVDKELVNGTPVDTGAARSNWVASLGDETADFIPPYSPGRHLGIGERANADAAISQAESVIAARKPGEDIAISNNTPYIGKLNDGTSAQAPANFVQIAVEKGIEVVRNAKVVP